MTRRSPPRCARASDDTSLCWTDDCWRSPKPGWGAQVNADPLGLCPPCRAKTVPPKDTPRMWTYWASADRVVDGDTVDLRIDLGFRIEHIVKCRIAGINAPEIRTDAGLKAAAELARLLVASKPKLKVVSSKPFGGGDKYGRWLASIELPSGVDVATHMIEMNFAKAWDGKGPKP